MCLLQKEKKTPLFSLNLIWQYQTLFSAEEEFSTNRLVGTAFQIFVKYLEKMGEPKNAVILLLNETTLMSLHEI